MTQRYLPLYEAKMIWQFDHRYGSYEGIKDRSSTQIPTPSAGQYADPGYAPLPWYWVSEGEVDGRLAKQGSDGRIVWEWKNGWLLGFRDITNSTNERTAIFSLMPRVGVGHTCPLVFPERLGARAACLLAAMGTIVFDYSTRQKVAGTHLTYSYLEQLPLLPPAAYSPPATRFIVPRVLELTYTAWDIRAFADGVWSEADDELRAEIMRQWRENKAVSSQLRAASSEAPSSVHSPLAAHHSPLTAPFVWLDDRRAVLRAELDAFYAALYGLTRKQLRYILDPHGLSAKELEDILAPWEDPTCSGPHLLPAEPALDFPGETFRVLKEKEEKQFGEYRTRRLVLEAWERLNREGLLPEPYDQRAASGEMASGRKAVSSEERAASREEAHAERLAEPVEATPRRQAGLVEAPIPQTVEPHNPNPIPPSPFRPPAVGDHVTVSEKFQGVIKAIEPVVQPALDLDGKGPKLLYTVVIDGTGEVKKFQSPPARVEMGG